MISDYDEAIRLVNRASRRVITGQRPSHARRTLLAALVAEDGLVEHDWLRDEELELDKGVATVKVREIAEGKRAHRPAEQVYTGCCCFLYHNNYFPIIDCSMVGKRQVDGYEYTDNWIPPTIEETIKCVDAATNRAKRLARETGYAMLMYADPENLYQDAQRRARNLNDWGKPVAVGESGAAAVAEPPPEVALSAENQTILDELTAPERGERRVMFYREPWDADKISEAVWPAKVAGCEFWKL